MKVSITVLDPILTRVDEGKELIDECLSFTSVYYKQGPYRKERKSYVKKLIHKGVFWTGLVPRVQEYCKRENIDLSLTEKSFEKLWINLRPLFFPPPKMNGFDLRQDQLDLIRKAITQARGVIQAPTGSGKTALAAGLIKCYPKAKTLFLCHTKTLIDQTAKMFRDQGLLVSTVVEGKADLSGNVVVATHQSFKKVKVKGLDTLFQIVIIDECFAKGTPVITSKGKLSIETVKTGDIVLSHTGWNKVTRIFSARVPLNRVVRLVFSNGKSICCSIDHLFYAESRKMWIPAFAMKHEKIFGWEESLNGQNETTLSEKRISLRNLWDRVHRSILQETKVLLYGLHVQKSGDSESPLSKDDKDQYQIQGDISTENDRGQPFQKSGGCRKREDYQRKKWNIASGLGEVEGRKWNGTASPSEVISRGYWLAYGDFCSDNTSKCPGRTEKSLRCYEKHPTLLQGGCGGCRSEDSDRGGWEWAQKEPSFGPKERSNSNSIRVESVEIYQPGSNDEHFQSVISDRDRNRGYVEFYDLEVENAHTYFAGGALVHNCHHVSSLKVTYAEILSKLLCPIRIGLTATVPTAEESVLAMEAFLGPVIGKFSVEDGVDLGILAMPRIQLMRVPKSIDIVDLRKYSDIYDTCIVRNESRNRIITRTTRGLVNKEKSVLILVTKIEHGTLLMDSLAESGIASLFVRGSTEREMRVQIQEAFQQKRVNCVIATATWREGVNVPSLDCVINAAGGKSEIFTIQSIGRGLRTTNSKQEVLIVDFLDPYKYLSEHAIQRISIYVENGWI